MYKELLMNFCSKDQSRSPLCNPFNVGCYTYATDGHIAIRIPRMPVFSSNEPVENIEKVWFKGTARDSDYIPVPNVPKERIYESCPSCRGSGRVRQCPDCEGEGVITFESNTGLLYDIDCRNCNNKGVLGDSGYLPDDLTTVPCERCCGEGIVPKNLFMRIGNRLIACHLLSLMGQLPNCRLAPGATTDFMAIPFSFDEGEGIVMPARDDGTKHIITPDEVKEVPDA